MQRHMAWPFIHHLHMQIYELAYFQESVKIEDICKILSRKLQGCQIEIPADGEGSCEKAIKIDLAFIDHLSCLPVHQQPMLSWSTLLA